MPDRDAIDRFDWRQSFLIHTEKMLNSGRVLRKSTIEFLDSFQGRLLLFSPEEAARKYTVIWHSLFIITQQFLKVDAYGKRSILLLLCPLSFYLRPDFKKKYHITSSLYKKKIRFLFLYLEISNVE
jgi:hypothetical protein